MKVTVVCARPHALAYSFVGIQTLYLATNYPVIYWNCACLIIKSGGAELLDIDEDNIDNSEDENEINNPKKKKNKTADYGKISTAIGESRSKGIIILPPDINKSDLIFKPDINRNAIIYGLKGINKIGDQLIKEIFNNRPFINIFDFINKVKVNKTQMVSLIKAGVFDNLYNDKTRYDIMHDYLLSVADQKKRITLQNMKMLQEKNLIPEELDYPRRVYNFNKFLKDFKNGNYYHLNERGYAFFANNYDGDKVENVVVEDGGITGDIKQTIWDKIYDKEMDKLRAWMKANQQEILDELNSKLLQEIKDKYAQGSLSQWEMESLSFYYHEHELAALNTEKYEIDDYFKLPEDPEVDKVFPSKDGGEITMFKIHRIAGTVIDKDKNKSTVTLLTPTGVVVMKIWKNQFAKWDKQISEMGPDGKKHVVEKSFFSRGTKMIVTGIRREGIFSPKKYKSTDLPLFEKIIELDERGNIVLSQTERMEEETI